MKVTVTQEHIDRGTRLLSTGCPVARAIAALGFTNVTVGGLTAYAGPAQRWALPKTARQFIEKFDGRKPVSPFTFVMKSHKI